MKGILLLSAALLALVGCSQQTTVESDLGIDGAPDWVNEGTQVVSDDGGRLIHGVGSAPPMNNPSLQRATADNRARAEVARVLASYMDVAVSDYQAASGNGEGMVADESIQLQINATSQVMLNGVRILGRWRNPDTDVVYSFAELDLERVEQVVAATEQMNPGFRDYLGNHSQQLFDQFARGQRQ